MKAFLMYRDRDLDLNAPLPAQAPALVQDLDLETLFEAMSLGDEFLSDVARAALLTSLTDAETIRYRQDILKDCLENADLIRSMYALAVEALERERKEFFSLFRGSPGSILYRSRGVLDMLLSMLCKLKAIAEENASAFTSDGLDRFFRMLREELDADFFASARSHLRQLQFPRGVLISARLGKGEKAAGIVLHETEGHRLGWLPSLLNWLFEDWVSRKQGPDEYSFRLHPRDESGARALSEFRDKGVNLVANTLAQSVDHILSFFRLLRAELAFYVGCLNLHSQLLAKGEPACFPEPAAPEERRHNFSGLYDVCLSLSLKGKAVGNGMTGNGKALAIITGANQGGKTVFLRSIGLAQLMMQAGMFVGAEAFSANIASAVFTHFKREEDHAMKSGKLDEELKRMSDIVQETRPNALVLLNESFAATNEREGSEIARQIVAALLEKQIKVFFVTHLYDFAHSLETRNLPEAIFLRVERQSDGRRTFKLREGGPLETSYGEDLYNRIFMPASGGITHEASSKHVANHV